MSEGAGLEQSLSFNDRKMAPSTSGFACGFVGAFVTMLAIILLLFVYERPPLQKFRTSAFCCPQVLKDIFGGANSGIDPCRSIFDHTCYAYVATRDGHSEQPALNRDPVDGGATAEAGRAVAAYLRACLFVRETETSPHGRAAADVLLNVTNPPKAPPTSYYIVSLIVELSLKYGLPSLIQFETEKGGNSTVYLRVSVPTPLDSVLDNPSASMLSAIEADALEVVNHYFSLKLSLQDIDAFLAKLRESSTNGTENYSFDSLGDIHPELTALQWKEILGTFDVTDNVAIYGVSLQELKDAFAHILNPDQRPLSLVSALVSASARLASRLVMKANSSEDRSLVCRERASDLLPLLVLDRIEYFRSKSQDDAIVAAFRVVARAVLSRAKSGMESGDFRRLTTALNGMRVALPSEVIPEDLVIPTMTSNYARAELVARAFVRRAQRHQMISLGVSEGFAKHFLGRNASFTEGVFVVPTMIYSTISLVNTTDPLLLASTVGVYIADALWNFVFSSDWGPVSNAALREYGSCIQDNSWSLIEWPSEIMWLSLATSIDAAHDAEWGSLVRPAGAWEVTRGQLFYMSFVHYLLCRKPYSRLATFGRDVNRFMSAFEDFYHSFHCDFEVSKVTGAVCSLQPGNSTG